MAIADKLAYLQESKKQIKNAIIEKGVSVEDTDSFRSYANKIGQIKGTGGSTLPETEEWQPQSDWWDIEKILEEDTEEYTMKIICLLTDELDDKVTTNTVKGGEKYKLSDGQVIEQSATTNLNITNLFDTSKDKECSKGYKTRYIIFYSKANTMSITLPDNVIYTIFSGVKFSSSPFANKSFLQSIKFINNSEFTSKSMNSMFSNCYSLRSVSNLDIGNVISMNHTFFNCYLLQNVPELDTRNVTSMNSIFTNCYSLRSVSNLDTSNITDMSSMFSGCYALKKVPNLDTANVTNMSNMFSSCYSLENVPNLDSSNVTSMSNIFSSCYSLKNIPNLDTTNVTSMSNIFSGCHLLIDIKGITKIGLTMSFSSSLLLNHKSLLKILNALIDLTGNDTQKLTLGSKNLVKLTDEEKAIATEKNWTLA